MPGKSSNVKGIVINTAAKVVNTLNAFGYQQSLEIANTSALEFKLPNAAKELTLKLSSTAQSNVNIPSQAAIEEDYAAMVDGINKVAAPIWRPNTKYLVEFSVK